MVGNVNIHDRCDTSTAADENVNIVLNVLSAVAANSTITQRSVARDLGIALGLANAYLKRCVAKGLVKVQQVPANRYAYYLTPKGFAEKSRLTADYLSISFNFFREARNQCSELMSEVSSNGYKRLVLAGTGDLAEIATLCANESLVTLIGIYDTEFSDQIFAGLPVSNSLTDMESFDAVLITNFRNPQETYDAVAEMMPVERIATPGLLGISRSLPTLME
ncbi:MAG: winged helix-turn-helix transcriptional regulator [Proteobacteria bacterium]|nr:winged helix-turn-helix transcriptional regulator [Pseudomonadota bacterium]